MKLQQSFRPPVGSGARSRKRVNMGLRFNFVQCPAYGGNPVPVRVCNKCPAPHKVNFNTVDCGWTNEEKPTYRGYDGV